MLGRVVGSNLVPGKKLDGLSKVFIISNTSFYNAYFSYNILAAISFSILILLLFQTKQQSYLLSNFYYYVVEF